MVDDRAPAKLIRHADDTQDAEAEPCAATQGRGDEAR